VRMREKIRTRKLTCRREEREDRSMGPKVAVKMGA
jgi:hypothetical protein